MVKRLLILSCLLLVAFGLKAQVPPPCQSNQDPPADFCSDICIYCNFNGMMGSTANYTGQTPPGGFCSGIQNEQWLGFIAGSPVATFTVTPSNCQNGNGLQIALYSSCDSAPIDCNGGQQGGGSTPMSITVTNMVPGVNYYLLIDGYGGDICDFTVTASPPSAVQGPNVGPTGAIQGPGIVCPGAMVTYSIPVVTGAGAYIWNGPPGSLINGMSPPVTLPAPGGRTVTVTMGPNSGQICVQPVNSCDDGTEVCKNVISQPIPPTIRPPVTVCAEDVPYTLPWGDQVFNSGLFENTYTSYQGCDSIVRQNVTVKAPIVRFLPPQSICAGTCITVCGDQYCDPGTYSLTCQSFQGCDSVINFSINVVTPVADIIPGGVITCANDTIILGSAPSPGSKVWRNTQGGVLGTGNSLAVAQPGTIILTVTAAAGTNLCTAMDTITVTANTTPPTVTATGGFLGCGNSQAQLSSTTNAQNPAYAWGPPDGLSATNIPNPIAALPGIFTVTVTNSSNGCTGTASVTVTGNTDPPLASATGATITCTANPVIVTSSTNVPNATFSWSGPLGFSSTQQNNPVGNPGTYTVTITNPANNCSATATTTVPINTTPPGAAASGGVIGCNTPTITLGGISPTGGVTFVWSGPSSFSSNTQNPIANTAGLYALTVTDPGNGCTSTASATVTGNTNPPTVSALGGTVSCGDPDLHLDGGSTTTGATFSWSGPNNFASTNEDPIVNAPGIYTLTVTGLNDCTATAVATVLGDFGVPDAMATGGIITCSSSSTTINGTSTTPGVTFEWTAPNGDKIPGANPIVSNTGVYTLAVTSPNGCSTTATAEVVPDANVPNASATGGTLNCLVFDVTLNGNSVTPGVTFTWNGPNGFTSALEDPLVTAPGTYTFVVTAVNGCSAIANAIVVLDDVAPGATATGGIVTCSKPDLDLMGESPTNNVTWAWTGPNGFTSPAQEPNVLEAGLYNLVVTGPNGCTSSSSAMVVADQALPIPASTTGTLTCATTNLILDGSANVPATWSWSGPNNFTSTDENPSVSAPGDYTLVATAANGCVDSVTITVAQDIIKPDVSASGNTITCTNPQVPLSGASATPGVTFEWFGPGFNSPQPNPLVNGNGAYTLIVTAPNGCTSEATVDVLLDTGTPVAFANSPDVLTCSLLAAQIATTANNSTSPIATYNWTGPGGFESFDEDPTVALPGVYNLVVTSQNGCTTTASVTVAQNVIPPDVSAVGSTLTCVILSTDLNGGSVTPGASYQWTGPGNFSSTLPDPTVTQAGNYVLTVTGPNGCTASATAPVILDAVFPDATATASNNLDCDDLSASLNGASTTPGVVYAWSDQSGNIFAVTPDASVTSPGTYKFAVTAPNGCVTQSFVLVTQDILPPGASTVNDTIDCISGDAPLLGSTQAQNVSWLWVGPGGLNSTLQNPVVSQAGVYTLTVTGANACTSTATATIFANTLSPDVLVGGAGILTCKVTQLTLTGTINTPGATGVWTDPSGAVISSAPSILVSIPGDYIFTVTAPNGCITAPLQTVGQDIETPQDVVVNGGLINCTTPTLTLMASTSSFNVTYGWTGPGGFTSALQNPTANTPGTYTVLLTNTINGCQATAVTFVTGDFVNPTVTATAPTITCSAPTATITATGTPVNVSYKWAGPGINASNQSVKNPTVSTAGTYTVTVTAANGCTGTTTVSVPANITNPNASATGVTLTCTQPSSAITGTSTTPNVTYSWSGPNGFTANVPSPTVNTVGLYTLTVTAPNGCTTTATATVVPDSNAPTASATSGTLTCSVTSLPLNGSSNIATVTWQWSGPNGFSSTAQNPTTTVPGLYTLVVRNPQNGCTSSATTTVLADTQGPLVSIGAPAQLNCSVTQVTLSATVQAPGNYVYEWGTGQGGTINAGGLSPTPTVGSAGAYTVTVTNQANGCSTVQSVSVTIDSSVVSGANFQIKDVSCFGRTDGGLSVASVVGGTAPFLYSLDNGPFTAQSVFGSLPPGTHDLAIQDANGCEWSTTFEVKEPEELIVELGPDTTVYLGESLLLTIDDVVNFPDRVVTRILEPAYLDTVFGVEFKPQASFRYVLTVADANGCRASDTRLVILDKTRFVYIPNVFDPGAADIDALLFISARESQVTKIKSFRAFDRWGNVVFERFNFQPNDPSQGWDGTIRGTKATPAVYTYFAEIEFVDNEVVLYKGDVTLLRNQ